MLTAFHNCVSIDWSSFGNGNLSVDPKLTNSGFLQAGSPCIDAGSDEEMLNADIDGVLRNAGSVDIGCQEFKDSDGDGIPDNIETAVGLNPADPTDAVEDADQDGIKNIDEYLKGTNIAAIDTDGDGFSDAAEIQEGYDPIKFTRIVYLDPAGGNDENNGLSPNTAQKSFRSAIEASQMIKYENVVLAAPGVYSGVDNKNLDFKGFEIKLRSTEGAATTVIDLENDGRFLHLTRGETTIVGLRASLLKMDMETAVLYFGWSRQESSSATAFSQITARSGPEPCTVKILRGFGSKIVDSSATTPPEEAVLVVQGEAPLFSIRFLMGIIQPIMVGRFFWITNVPSISRIHNS